MKFTAIALAALLVQGAWSFVPHGVSSARSATLLYGDGNPPPFGSWATPSPPAPAPVSSPPPFGGWAPPAPASAQSQSGNPPPFSSWGMPAAPPAPAPAPVAAPAAASAAAPAQAMSGGGDPIATMDASQAAIVQSIASGIPDLDIKADLSWSGEPIGGSPSSLDGRDAAGPANVAWLANVNIPGKLSSLTIFNGPLTNVPHLLSRCYFDGQSLELALDFRPRAYGAYEMVDAEGNYPGPEQLGRKAFEYSGARMDFFNKFGTKEFQAELTGMVQSLQGATALQPSEMDLVTGGPLAIALSMPANDHNVQTVAKIREFAATSWLSWATDKSGKNNHRPGAPINTQYVYDAKFRQNAYMALKEYYSKLFGPGDGSTLAVGESGPLDEAYVGGGS